ncbi:MAG: carboxyltransferase domain-containing protein [Leucobacter sp.]
MTVTAHAMGDSATLLECEDLAHALQVVRVLEAARDARHVAFDECVVAAQTVLVLGGMARTPQQLVACVKRAENTLSLAGDRSAESSEAVVPVVYEGPDLRDVAEFAGISVEEVVARHTAAEYLVGFTGFAPGFAYLSGGDPLLDVPRRPSPRARISAGAVGLAGPYSGVYPRESPGGWQIIGVTDLVLWDADRASPATLVPGARVRFEAVRATLSLANGVLDSERVAADAVGAVGATVAIEARSPQAPCSEMGEGRPALTVLDPGLQSLVEDAGRPGLAGIGVGRSGAADASALREANRLVGNAAEAAVLEVGPGCFSAVALRTLVVALAGAPRKATVARDGVKRQIDFGEAFRIDSGETLELGDATSGVRTTVALRGGVEATKTLGSASHDTLSRLGPPVVQRGDVVRVGAAIEGSVGHPSYGVLRLPQAGDEVVLRISRGPRANWFEAESHTTLVAQRWQVMPQSDRVGLRLDGSALFRATEFEGLELPSEGVVNGAIQVPPNGQPVIFLTDHPVTGGYPVICVVKAADLDLAAQVPPGAVVRFELDDVTPSAHVSHTYEEKD